MITARSNSAMAGELLSLAARLDLQKLGEIGNCTLYGVTEEWKIATLTKEAGVATASTLHELEKALSDNSVHSIFVPAFSFGRSALESVIKRHNAGKTIYWQGAYDEI